MGTGIGIYHTRGSDLAASGAMTILVLSRGVWWDFIDRFHDVMRDK